MTTAIGLYREMDVGFGAALRALAGRPSLGTGDYQLIEEETADGRPRLRLLVHPRVGPLDEPTVADVFLAAIGGGSGAERVMELQWRQGGVVRAERCAPLVSAAAKVSHVSRVVGRGG